MWSNVFLAQAKSDWEVYEFLDKSAFPDCHTLHYLQMATEKLAKAYILTNPADVKSVTSTHRALTRFFQDVSRNKMLRHVMGMSAKQLRAHIQHLLPIAYEIERLAPVLAANGPNPEYPWETPKGEFHAPAIHEFSISKILREPRGYSLLKLIRITLTEFDTIHSQ